MSLSLDLFGSPELTLLAASTFGLWLILGFYNTRLLAILALLLYGSHMTNSSVMPPLGIGYAVLALAVAVLTAALRGRMPRFEVLRSGVFPAVLAYVFVAIATMFGSADLAQSIETVIQCLFAVAFAWLLISALEPDEVRSGIRWSMGFLCAASLVAVVVMPDVAISGLAQRWRGVTDNANSFAIMASFYLLSARTVRGMHVGLVPTVIIMLGTATRSAALGLAVASGPQFLRNKSLAVRRIFTTVALLASIPLLYSVFFVEGSQTTDAGDGSITRVSNSRADSWGEAVGAIAASPITGVGAGNDRLVSDYGLTVHSSVLRPMVEVGLGALIPLGLVVAAGVRSTRAGPSQFRSIFAFMLVLGVFEGWLFAGGSIFFVFFMISAYYALHPPGSGDLWSAEAEPDAESEPARLAPEMA